MHQRKRHSWFMLPIMLLVSSMAIAGTTGKISGVVTDKDTKQPLPGVNIVVEGTTMGAATDANGRYFILQVPPGSYNLVVTMMGYQSTKATNLKVSVDLTTTQNFEISSKVLELGEAVEIIADRPLIQKDGVTTMQIA